MGSPFFSIHLAHQIDLEVALGKQPLAPSGASRRRAQGRQSACATGKRFASLTLFFLAASATEVRSASRRIATICSSLNRLLRIGSSLSKEPFLQKRTDRRTDAGQRQSARREPKYPQKLWTIAHVWTRARPIHRRPRSGAYAARESRGNGGRTRRWLSQRSGVWSGLFRQASALARASAFGGCPGMTASRAVPHRHPTGGRPVLYVCALRSLFSQG